MSDDGFAHIVAIILEDILGITKDQSMFSTDTRLEGRGENLEVENSKFEGRMPEAEMLSTSHFTFRQSCGYNQ